VQLAAKPREHVEAAYHFLERVAASVGSRLRLDTVASESTAGGYLGLFEGCRVIGGRVPLLQLPFAIVAKAEYSTA
jgi:hypothetical protein